MKFLLTVTVALMATFASYSQTMTVNNGTACTIFMYLAETNSACVTAFGKSGYRFIRAAATTPDRSATAMENTIINSEFFTDFSQVILPLIERPIRHEIAAVFVTIGIAEHDFLKGVAPFEVLAVNRRFENVRQERLDVLKILDGFEEWYNIDRTNH